jgi:hypothetical protein
VTTGWNPTGISAASLDAPTPAITIDAAVPAAAFALPAGATVVKETGARTADASALGTHVTVRLVEKIGEDTGDRTRHVDQLLALEGTGAVVVELGFSSDDQDAFTHERLRTVAPLAPPRPFATGDAGAELPFQGPLLYLGHWKTDDLAVAQDGDALVVWRLQTLIEEGEEGGDPLPFFEQARIALAPGAKLTPR